MTFTEYLCKAHNLNYQTEFKNYKAVIPQINYRGAMISAVFNSFGTTEAQLIGITRERPIVMQRHAIMYFLHSTRLYTLKEIGLMFGGRNHASVIHAFEKVEGFLSYNDCQFMPYYEVIKAAFEEVKKQNEN
jgi:chromosomal replication initiation ATPase DnaA